MIDRLISGAGAIAHAADRTWTALHRGWALGPIFAPFPGSVAFGALAVLGAAAFAFAGVEATGNPEPRSIGPAEVFVGASDVGGRAYASIEGVISASYVETYDDENGNGQQDADETGKEWFYYLLDRGGGQGIVVRSERSPEAMYTRTVRGTLVRDPDYVAEDMRLMTELDPGLEVERTFYIDETRPGSGEPVVLAPGPLAQPPADGAAVSLTGAWEGPALDIWDDANRNGKPDPGETSAWDYLFIDPATNRGTVVYSAVSPDAFPISLTGMLRDQPGTVREATEEIPGLDLSELGIEVSPRFILDEGARPASAPISFALSVVLVLLAFVLFVGRAGGYLVFRRQPSAFLGSASTLAAGESLPARATGTFRTAAGLRRVRETPAVLRRVELEPTGRAVTAAAMPAPGDEAARPPDAAEPVASPGPAPTSLAVTSPDGSAGVGVGRGELTSLQVGTAYPFRGARPALRAATGTGRLILSFDDSATRDRAVGELRAEGGLVLGGDGIARA